MTDRPYAAELDAAATATVAAQEAVKAHLVARAHELFPEAAVLRLFTEQIDGCAFFYPAVLLDAAGLQTEQGDEAEYDAEREPHREELHEIAGDLDPSYDLAGVLQLDLDLTTDPKEAT